MKTYILTILIAAAILTGCGGAGGSASGLGSTPSGGGGLTTGSTGGTGDGATTGTTGSTTDGSTTGTTGGSTDGGTTGTTGGSDPAGLTVVATDNSIDTGSSAMDAYSSAFVTVHEVDLIGAGGTVVVFNDAIGVSFDLKQLQDSSGAMFAFLSHSSVPVGTYTSARIVFDSTFSAVLASNGSNVTLHFDPSLSIGGGQSAITYALVPPFVVDGTEQVLAVDLNVHTWTVGADGTVYPVVDSGSTSGVDDPLQQIPVQMAGFIRNLVPTTSFTLTRGSKVATSVRLSDATTVSGNRQQTLNSLANGQHVILTAAWNETTRSLAARNVKITGH